LGRVHRGPVRPAVPPHVLGLHLGHQVLGQRVVVAPGLQRQRRGHRSRQPWSTGPVPAPSGNPAAIAPVTYSFAPAPPPASPPPRASRAATALATRQPVPWA